MLAALLLRPDQVVADEQLLYDVWGEDLPSNPRAAMQAAISRFRRALSRAELRNERRTARHAANLLRDAGSNMHVARIAHLAE